MDVELANRLARRRAVVDADIAGVRLRHEGAVKMAPAYAMDYSRLLLGRQLSNPRRECPAPETILWGTWDANIAELRPPSLGTWQPVRPV
jgi:hypothetical protein